MTKQQDRTGEFSSKVYLEMELLRFTTAGSVDDGKSTLIGRLLYDSKSIFEDQLDAVKKASLKKGSKHLNLALLTDGLRAEREQGITIDVAYRYFATPRRKFIIADTPGHIQYTRNMVTGASTANAAIILIDARNGVTEQTHRHAYIASLLEIPHIIVCINKMDLQDYKEEVFNRIKTDFKSFSDRIFPGKDVRFIPISALHGNPTNFMITGVMPDALQEGFFIRETGYLFFLHGFHRLLHLSIRLPTRWRKLMRLCRFPLPLQMILISAGVI
jgi:sulfate adenylyltransferase subunit 1